MRDRTMDKLDAGVRVFLIVLGSIMISWFVAEVVINRFRELDTYSCQNISINVAPGDDYWGYAEKYCEGNITHITDDLIEVYGMPLQVGNVVYLPKSNKCEIFLKVDQGQQYAYEVCK